MLNPINAKLQKMFLKRKKQNSAFTAVKIGKERKQTNYERSVGNRFSDKENNKNDSNIKPIISTPQKTRVTKVSNKLEYTEKQLQDCLKTNQDLKKQIETHQMMEQFYKAELQMRLQNQKDLQWRLKVIGEEVLTNRKPKVPKPKKNVIANKIEMLRNCCQE